MDPNNRLRLNFGAGAAPGYGNDHNYAANDGRVFPTTPSTFPQPIFPTPAGQQQPANDYLGTQLQSPGGYGAQSPGGYFPPTFQQQQYGQQQQQPQYANQYQHSIQSPQPSYQQRPGYPSDPTSVLTRQFSNQNLGPQRHGSPLGRQPSPSGQRNRTGTGQGQHTYSSHLTPPIAGADGKAEAQEEEKPPEKNPDKYSPNVVKRGQGLHALVETFFKENITRARDRNLRYDLC